MQNIFILILGLIIIGFGIKLFKQKPQQKLKTNSLFDQITSGFGKEKKEEKEKEKTSLFDQITTGNFEEDDK